MKPERVALPLAGAVMAEAGTQTGREPSQTPEALHTIVLLGPFAGAGEKPALHV